MENQDQPVTRLDLILLFQAYNRKEISFDEFIRLTREWAEAMQRQYAKQQEQAMPD
jgi:hypothetical protein